MNRSKTSALPLVLLSGSVLTTTPALAQTAPASPVAAGQVPFGQAPDSQVGEVVVTARQRAETLLDAPIAVNAITSQTLQRQQIEDVHDLVKVDSSLVFDRNFGLQDTRPQIRGLPASRGRPAVGVLVDGVDTSSESMGASAGGSQLFNLRLVDLDRIEVVKGPQSALYGRVAFGGAINYISKKPSHTVSADLSGSAGAYGQREVRAAATGPINDQLAIRVNGYYANFDGFYKNSISGQPVGGYESYGGMAQIAYDPDPRAHVLLQLSYSEETDAPQATEYLGAANGQDVLHPIAPTYLTSGVPGAAATAPVSAPPFGTVGLSPSGVRLSVDPRTGKDFEGAKLKTFRGGLHFTYDLGFAELTSITSITHARFSEIADDDFYGAPIGPVLGPLPGTTGEQLPRFGIIDVQGGNVSQINQELRLGHLDGGPFRWAIGSLYWYENYKQDNVSYTSVAAPTTTGAGPNDPTSQLAFAGYSGGLNTAETIGTVPNGAGQRITHHLSGYVLAEYDFLTQFTASFEARYSHETYDYIFSPYLYTATATAVQAPALIYATPAPASTGTDFLTPKFLLRYKPTDNLMAYGSISKGEKPGGYNTVSITSSTGNRFGPEQLWNYELGLKGQFFERRLAIEMAAFYMDYTNKQESVIVANPATPTGYASAIQNVGGAEVKGIEFNATYQPVHDVTLSVGYTHLDDKYTDYRVDANSALTASLIGGCSTVQIGTGVFCQTNLKGKRLELTPTDVVVANGRYSHPVKGDISAFIEGDARYTSDRPLEEYNVRFIPAQTIANLRLGLQTHKWTGLIYIDNLFDQDKVSGGFFAGDMFYPGRTSVQVFPADKRTAGVRLSYHW